MPEASIAQRSAFVTVVAWVFIVLSGFATLISTMQSVMFYFIFSDPRFQATMHAPPKMENAPGWLQFFFTHPWIFFVLFWAVSLATLISAIGLLRRRNWARILFISILGLGIVWNVGAIAFQGFFYSGFTDLPPQTPPEFAVGFKAMAMAVTIGSVIFAVGLSILFVWIIKRLCAQSIRGEFRAL